MSDRIPLTRREFCALTAAGLGLSGIGAQDSAARLKSRPRSGVTTTATGEKPLGLGTQLGIPRDGLLRIPTKPVKGPMPLLVLLHGAASSGETQLHRFTTIPDEFGLAVLAPDSRLSSWDAIGNDFDRDVKFIDKALEYVFGIVNVDPRRITLGGFSDGATYALSLGMANGDLFQRIVAFSPGFLIPAPPVGKPAIFISHGTADHILPIDRCSRLIVPELRKRGYDVTYKEFDGDHAAPEPIAREGLHFAAGK